MSENIQEPIAGNAANLLHELEQELGVKGPANVLREALKLAREAAAQAKAAAPPAPPAWMVEVSREGAVAGAVASVLDRDGRPPAYAPGNPVQKITGDYQISGIVRGAILTGAGLWRYAVEHKAEGGGAFLHIYAGANLSALPTREA